MIDRDLEPPPSPETPLQACLTAGERAIDENRWPEAVKWLVKARELIPADTAVLGKLGFCLSRNQEYQRAIEVFTDLSTREPKVARWPYMVGYQYYVQSQWAEALRWFDKALSIQPTYLIVLYRKGITHLRMEQLTEAERAFKSCLTIWEDLPSEAQQEKRSSYSEACFQLGKIYLKKGLTFKSRRCLTLAVEHDPDHADKRYELGKCLLQIGLANEAIKELRHADTLNVGVDYVIDRLAQAYIAIGDLTEAEQLYSRIPPYRRREYVLRNIGILYFKQERYEESVRNLLEAIRKEPRNHHSHYYLGLAHEALDNLVKARQAYREAIQIRQKRYNKSYPEAEERLRITEEQLAARQALEETTVCPSASEGENSGKIVFYNSQRGFGFIQNPVGERFFFHVSDLPAGFAVREGVNIEFNVKSSPKGLQAINLLLKEREA
jgi:tetratricopeptide (TPR) repeat protein